MATQLIMTVGTNALPVWVAWYHLKDKLDDDVSVRFIYTTATKNERILLEKYCSNANFGAHIQTSSGNPGTVRGDIRTKILNGLDENTPHLHVHYTGGTKVMGVETVSAIENRLPNNARLDTTYLDPRGDSGPCLISRSTILVKDTRKGIEPNLKRIALLNGFTLASFVHEYWDRNANGYKKEEKPEPAILDQNQQNSGTQMLDDISKRDHSRITPTNFEYAVYVAMKMALNRIHEDNSNRSNFEIYHKVFVRRTGANQRDGIFELDVVVLLGYQLIVISCTLKTGNAAIKEKGMEVIMRARQLGGDEAQTIVLCKANHDTARRVEKELHNEVGSGSLPLQVWGKDKWGNLQNHFKEYLINDLHWR